MNIRCLSLLCAALVGTSGLCSRTLSSQMQLAGSRDRSASGDSAVLGVELQPPTQGSSERRIAISLNDVPLKTALREIARKSSININYNDADIPAARLTSIDASDVTALDALRMVLRGTGLAARASDSGISIEQAGTPMPRPSRADSTGSISGHVTDSTTGNAVQGARVTLERTNVAAVAADDGGFQIAEVAPGSYVVTARRLGYLPASRQITVSTGSETVVNIRLVPAPRTLDQVVTTGTVVPTDVRKLPNPISIISESDIAAQHPRTLSELLREFVPGMVAWDAGNYPQNTSISVRGAATMSGSGMKIYVDGMEVASRTNAAIDPASIERVEVIRGPEAATIYGSDAIGGVVQVFTKRGDTTVTKPRLELRTAWGAVQSGYVASNTTLRQEYSGSVRGAGPGFSYNLGASYVHLGEWIPQGTQSLPSIFGGIRINQGDFTFDLSGRSYEQKLEQTSSPVAATTGYAFYSRPFYTDVPSREQSLSGRTTWQPNAWLRQSLTVGLDRFLQASEQYRPRLITPTDTLLELTDVAYRKELVAYHASAIWPITHEIEATLTAGVDHYRQQLTVYSTSGAISTTGVIVTDAGSPISGSRDEVTNTGYFGQLQAEIGPALTVTAAVRAEQNSNFGADVGTVTSPRFGIAYNIDVGQAAIKLRSSYGEAILPPSPNQSQGRPLGAGTVLLSNPGLEPQRQSGWDAGADISLDGGISLGITYYRQVARDLIQFLVVTPPFQEYQYQNVGRIRNSGLEVEGKAELGRARVSGQFAITNSEVTALSLLYTGDLHVGDRPLELPKYTAGASLSMSPWRKATLTAGVKYVGGVRNYDGFAQLSCAAGTGPCLATERDYLIDYPGFAKVDLAVTQQLTRWISGFVAVNNIANNNAAEQNNVTVPNFGRVTTVGVEAHF